jgi:epoxide hydrolase
MLRGRLWWCSECYTEHRTSLAVDVQRRSRGHAKVRRTISRARRGATSDYLGMHVLQLFSFPSGDPSEFENLEPKDYAALEHMQWFQSVGGYNAINASRPQTVAVGIADSPVGQLAWSELFNSFGNGTSLVTHDQILTQVTLYWFTNTQATAGRYHYVGAHAGVEPAINSAPT